MFSPEKQVIDIDQVLLYIPLPLTTPAFPRPSPAIIIVSNLFPPVLPGEKVAIYK